MESIDKRVHEVAELTFGWLQRLDDGVCNDLGELPRDDEDVARIGHGVAREERSGDQGVMDGGRIVFAGGDAPQARDSGPKAVGATVADIDGNGFARRNPDRTCRAGTCTGGYNSGGGWATSVRGGKMSVWVASSNIGSSTSMRSGRTRRCSRWSNPFRKDRARGRSFSGR